MFFLNRTNCKCKICLDPIKRNKFISKCNHIFHKICINKWKDINMNNECPLCRKQLN